MSPYAPANCREIEELLSQHRLSEALISLRRYTRCDSQEGRMFLSELARSKGDWFAMARTFSHIVAPLCHDPSPHLLQKMEPHRHQLLRLLRRGRRLEALRLIQQAGDLEQAPARLFCEAVQSRAHCWDAVLLRYSGRQLGKERDFFANWPPAAPPAVSDEGGLFLAPSTFTPELLEQRMEVQDIRSAVLLVRRFGFVETAVAQSFVDELEDLKLDRVIDPWSVLAQKHPRTVANLMGDPDPNWLVVLEPQRGKLRQLQESGRKLEAARLVEESVGTKNSADIRRFMERMPDADWGDVQSFYGVAPGLEQEAPRPPVASPTLFLGAPDMEDDPFPEIVAAPPKPAPAAAKPEPPKPAPPKPPSSLPGPPAAAASKPAPPPSMVTPAAHSPVKPPSKPAPTAHAVYASSSKGSSAPLVALTFSQEASAVVQQAALKFEKLDDLGPHLDKLITILDSEGPEQAQEFFRQLEAAGFNRKWAVSKMPALANHLPPEPWADKLPELIPFLRDLQGWVTLGGIPSQLLVQAPLAKVSQALGTTLDLEDLEELYEDVKDCMRSGKLTELEPSLKKILESPRGEKELRARVPMLVALFPDNPITLEGLRALKGDPKQILLSLLKRKNPKILEQLDTDKLLKLVAGWPELKDWMKRGQFQKASVFLFKELSLGPADIADFLKIIRELL